MQHKARYSDAVKLGSGLNPCWFAGLAALTATLGTSARSSAHIELSQPVPRAAGRSPDPNANLKEGPCGQEENRRTETVNVFEPGQSLDVVWREYVNHRSYYRVAFDPDGDDGFPVFPGVGISAEGDDPTLTCPVDGRVILAYDLDDRVAGEHTLRITLPDVECDNCTLQLIQYMYDTGRPYYFQCADLALRRGAVGALDGGARDAAANGSGGDDTASDDAGPPYSEFRAADSCSAPLPSRPRPSEQEPPAPVPVPGTDAGSESPPERSDVNSNAEPRSSGCGVRRRVDDRAAAAAALCAILVALSTKRRRAPARATS